MKISRRLIATVIVAASAVAVLPALADSGATTLSWSHPSTAFSGGPLIGGYHRGTCAPTSCGKATVVVDQSVAGGWSTKPGGLVVSISWADRDAELDLFVYDSKGNELDMQNFGGVTSQRAFVGSPPAGTYEIWVQSFSGTATSFSGTASIAGQPAKPVTTSNNTMQFSPPALVDPQLTTAEPGIRLGPSGQTYIDAPWHASTATSMLWQSQPGESDLTYRLLQARPAGLPDPRPRTCSTTSGGADSDVAVTRTGTLLFADLEAFSVSVSRSTDNGASWSCTPVDASTPDADRPWIAAAPNADGTGPAVDAYLTYRAYSISGQFAPTVTMRPARLQIDVTRDDGQTWQSAGELADGSTSSAGAPIYVKDPGQVFTDSMGGVFVPFASPNGRAYIARSLDGGATFTVSLVAQRLGTPDYGFVAGAADAAGALYVAWVDQGTYSLVYSRSSDRGRTWSAPMQVNPVGTSAVLPWLAAGRGGDVAIGWYGSTSTVRPDLQPATATWLPYVARSRNAADSSPQWERAALSPSPVHVGPLCVADTSCDPSTRRFGDMMMLAIGADGAIRATYDDDAGGAAPYLVTVEQIAGNGRRPDIPAVTAERRSDTSVAQLDFTGLPHAQRTQAGVVLQMPVASTDDLPGALSSYDDGAATSAMWLLTWRGRDGHVRFAGAQTDRTGSIQFLGGATPGAASFGPDSTYATYADQTPTGQAPVTGTLRDGVITIAIPAWLGEDYTFRALQAWSMVGEPQESEPLPLTVADSTPPPLPNPPAQTCPNPHATRNPHCH